MPNRKIPVVCSGDNVSLKKRSGAVHDRSKKIASTIGARRKSKTPSGRGKLVAPTKTLIGPSLVLIAHD